MRAELAGLLELQERSGHSVTELRVLLELDGSGDSTVSELAERLAAHPMRVRDAARQLASRGLIRSRYLERRERLVFAVTPAGLAVTEPLIDAFTETPALAA